MASESLKILTWEYAKVRNKGLDNHSNITLYEYEWAGLSYPDGYKPDEDDFKPRNRLNKKLTIKDYFRMD